MGRTRRDRRSRKYYSDRFDFRKNVVDWDYHMRVVPSGQGTGGVLTLPLT